MSFKSVIYLLLLFVVLFFLSFQGYRIWQLKQTQFVDFEYELKEISGIEFDKNQWLWAINDGGDEPKIYQLSAHGTIKKTIQITNAKNWDWEDMTQDNFGHFFIGDFGNNNDTRDWMTIYKIENPIDIKTDKTKAEIIKFTYPDYISSQHSENNEQVLYDVEAFVHFENSLYLFTKNRKVPFDGKTRLYRIGDYAANFEAEFISEFVTCKTLRELCWITSAALSPDRKKLVLLDSERLWLFENWQNDDFFSGDVYQIDLGIVTQKEAVTFFDNDTIIFADEVFGGVGGNAYVIGLDDAIKKPIDKSFYQ